MAIRFTEKEYEEYIGGKPKTRKYHNKRVVFDGRTFDSEHERDRYAELKLLERAGAISELKIQPAFTLVPAVKEKGKVVQRAVTYKADFSYIRDGKLIVEDAKGVRTDVYKLKKKLMRAVYGIVVEEV